MTYRPARAASPTASTVTTETTTSSDKPLASGKKSKPSPLPDGSVNQPVDGQIQTILLEPSSSQVPPNLEPLQVNNLSLMADLPASNAPSPTGSTSTTTTGLNGQGKESQNGMLFPPSVNGRKRPGPKPASNVEETEEDADSGKLWPLQHHELKFKLTSFSTISIWLRCAIQQRPRRALSWSWRRTRFSRRQRIT